MKKYKKLISREWEWVFLSVVLLALLPASVVSLVKMNTDPGERAGRKQTPKYESLLGEKAFAFLSSDIEDYGGDKNPFEFTGSLPEAKKPPKKKPRTPTPKPTPIPPPKEKPKVATPEPKPEPPKIVKRKVYGICEIRYLFNSINDSGKPVATIQITDPAARKVYPPRAVTVGTAIAGMQILSFDDQTLTIRDGKGRRKRISFGSSSRITTGPRIIEVKQ